MYMKIQQASLRLPADGSVSTYSLWQVKGARVDWLIYSKQRKGQISQRPKSQPLRPLLECPFTAKSQVLLSPVAGAVEPRLNEHWRHNKAKKAARRSCSHCWAACRPDPLGRKRKRSVKHAEALAAASSHPLPPLAAVRPCPSRSCDRKSFGTDRSLSDMRCT